LERAESCRPLSKFHNPRKTAPVTQVFFSNSLTDAAEAVERSCARLVQELARFDLDRFCKPTQRRDFRIALPGLHPTDLRDMDAAALRHLFLGESQAFPCLSQFGAEVAHGGDRLRLRQKAP
jgi:hypothetical protein